LFPYAYKVSTLVYIRHSVPHYQNTLNHGSPL